jgi:hypothetical protein
MWCGIASGGGDTQLAVFIRTPFNGLLGLAEDKLQQDQRTKRTLGWPRVLSR